MDTIFLGIWVTPGRLGVSLPGERFIESQIVHFSLAAAIKVPSWTLFEHCMVYEIQIMD